MSIINAYLGAGSGSAVSGRQITLAIPYPINTTAWSVTDSNSTVKASGSGSFRDTQITLLDGTYTLSITAYGVTKTKSFTTSSSNTMIDLTDMVCVVRFDTPSSLTTTMTIGGVSIGTEKIVAVLRDSSSLSYSGEIAEKIDNTAIANIANSTFIPISANMVVRPTIVGTRFLFTSSRSLLIPTTANYKLLLIGAGGGSSGGYCGGGGGHVWLGISTLIEQSYPLTIGEGSSTYGAGGATSFGTIATVQGGEEGKNKYAGSSQISSGGSGGSGGGAGRYSSYYTYGGDGDFGGGGGGGSGMDNSSRPISNGGSGGVYGGNGTSGSTNTDANTQRAQSGTDIDNSDGFFTSVEESYGGYLGAGNGIKSPYRYYGAGAGGGGYGALGGNGGRYTGSGGGGGGGGIAGGNGGAGGNVSSDTDMAEHGYGYGSGGADTDYSVSGGGGGGLYNVDFSSLGRVGAPGAIALMWYGDYIYG